MKRKKSGNKEKCSIQEIKTGKIVNQEFKSGDIAWVKLHNSYWWPAQVVDEECVSNKPKKKKDECLVRLYGAYEFMYVNALKSRTDFESIMKKEKKCAMVIFKEALEQDKSLMKSEGKSNGESPESKDDDLPEVSKQNIESIEPSTAETKEETRVTTQSKRKLEFDREIELPSVPKIKKQKGSKSTNQEILRSGRIVKEVLPPKNKIVKKKQKVGGKNADKMKATDLQIRAMVRDVLFKGENPISKGSKRKSNVTLRPRNGKETSPTETKNDKGFIVNVKKTLTGSETTPKSKKEFGTKSKKKEGKVQLSKKGNIGNSKDRRDDKPIESTTKDVTLESSKDQPVQSEVKRNQLSERKIRVMQTLALMAPPGSPFHRNGYLS